jgi:D-alanyl-D-alanine dipeptidase
VDVTIVDENGVELHMPTAYDVFTEQAHAEYSKLAENVIANRDYLQKVMCGNGFQIFPTEWWHFDFVGFENYPQLAYSFEDLM